MNAQLREIDPPLSTDVMNATEAAMRFYDHMRAHSTERAARVEAEFYLRRKCGTWMDADTAAVTLAGALALRAAARVNP